MLAFAPLSLVFKNPVKVSSNATQLSQPSSIEYHVAITWSCLTSLCQSTICGSKSDITVDTPHQLLQAFGLSQLGKLNQLICDITGFVW